MLGLKLIHVSKSVPCWHAIDSLLIRCVSIHHGHDSNLCETTWSTFCRRHFQIDSLECCIFIEYSLYFNLNGLIDDKPYMVHIMAWCPTGDESLDASLITVYQRIYALSASIMSKTDYIASQAYPTFLRNHCKKAGVPHRRRHELSNIWLQYNQRKLRIFRDMYIAIY